MAAPSDSLPKPSAAPAASPPAGPPADASARTASAGRGTNGAPVLGTDGSPAAGAADLGPGPIPAIYFDGRSAAAKPVWLRLHQGTLTLADRNRVPFLSQPLRRVRVQEALRNAPQRLELEGGATIVIEDKKRLALHLDRAGLGPGIIERAHRSWFTVGCALVALAGLVWMLQLWLIPWTASLAVRWLPASIEDRLVEQYWPETDRRLFQASALPETLQTEIRQRFAQLAASQPDAPEYHLEFRRWSGGANAFAFPGGLIVVTDELVRRAGPGDALMGVLAHELGHLAGRHGLRTIIQGAAIGSIYGLFFGDVGLVAQAVPTTLVALRYSRGFERNADDYAAQTLRRGRLPITPYADFLAGLHKDTDKGRSKGADLSRFLSSHPAPAQRIDRLRRAASSEPSTTAPVSGPEQAKPAGS